MSPGRHISTKLGSFILAAIMAMGVFCVFGKKAEAAVGVNKQINFQGKVVNADGTNVTNGSYNFNFRIYSQQAPGGSVIWSELTKSLTVTDGIFQTNLGDATALPGSVDFNTDNIFLGVEFNGNGEMTPRIQFTAAPYALNADKIHGLTVTDTTGTLTIATGKTLTASNTLTFQGTDSSTLNIGTGGTLGTAAYTASTAYLASGNSAQNGYFNDLYLDDTDASNHLILNYGSDVASDFTLGLIMTASRNLTIAGDASITGTNTGDQFTSTSASVILGRGSAGGAGAAQEITLGTNLSMSGTTLNATGGAGPFTDGTDITYLTDTTSEDFAIGASTYAAAPFGVDVENNTVRIGSGSTNNGILNMYASDGKTGSLEYTTSDLWHFSGGNIILGSENESAYFYGANATTADTNGGSLYMFSGTGLGIGDGGNLGIAAGNSGVGATGNGGQLSLFAGSSYATNGNGGQVLMRAGTGKGSGTGGNIDIWGGFGSSGGSAGGNVTIHGGYEDMEEDTSPVITLYGANLSSAGGAIEITGGATSSGDRNGGNVSLAGGSGFGAGSDGFVLLQSGGGFVGIGDATPDQLLEVLSSGAANTQLSIGNTNVGDYDSQIGFELADGTNTFTMGVDDSDSDKFKISTTALGTNDRLVIDANALTFANTTAIDDTLGFSITTGGAGRFAGTLTNADLTGARSWILPNLDGTVALTANKLSDFAATTSLELLGNISDETGTGKLTFATSPTFLTGVTLGDSTGATFVLTSALSGATDPTLTFGNDLITTSGDLKITGDDLFMNTNTTGYILVADGTNFNPVVTSGDVTINSTGATAIGANKVTGAMIALTSDAAGDMMYYNGTDYVRLPGSGTNDYVLKYNLAGSAPYWGVGGGGSQTPWTGNIDADNYTLTDLGTNITARAGLTIASVGAGALTLDSATGRVTIATGDFLNTSIAGVAGAASGDIWYDSTAMKFKINENSAVKTICNLTDGGCGGGGPFTDGTDITYLTDTTNEDFAIGASTYAGAPFGVDVENNTVRVGSGSTANAKIDMYASDGDTGSITYTTDDTWAFEGGTVGVGTTSTNGSMLQVGSATNRGNATLYGDLTTKGMKMKTTLANIVDTFIYDTTTDSDGGVWTNSSLAEQLSWYAETKDHTGPACVIGTDDRCGQSAFPKKAILVTTTTALHIFDANNGTLWMTFTQAGTYALGADTNNNPSGVFAMNGIIYVGTSGSSASGMYAFDFATDRLWRFNTTDRNLGDKNIANRNSAVTYNQSSITSMALADNIVNDVHGAVIYGGSALQTASGPLNGGAYVAAATDTGISVVSFTERRTWDIADNAGDDYNAVYLTKRGRLYALNENTDNLERYGAQVAGGVNIDWLFADNTSATPTWTYDDTATNKPNIGPATVAVGTSPDALEVVERGSLADEAADLIYVGTDQGLAEIHDVNIPSTAGSMGWSKFYRTTYTTAYQSGNTKGMWLMNDASGDLTNSTPLATNNALHNVVGAATYGLNGVHGSSIYLNNDTMFCSDADQNNACDVDTDYNPGDDSFTVELWFKHSVTAPASGTDTLVSRRFTAVPGIVAGWEIWMNTTCTIQFRTDDDATTWDDTTQITTTQTYCDDKWHHLVASRATTDGLQTLTIDGKTIQVAAVASAGNDGGVLTVGGDCSVGAACATGANFWHGSIDDLVISNGATSTGDATSHVQARKRFLEGKQAMEEKIINITAASAASGTTLTETGQTWTPNEFVGQTVRLTGGTGLGQTRKIIANSADTLTVAPAFSPTPDTTTDFSVNSETIYGATNIITSIGTNGAFLGKTRKTYVGTSDGSDGGGITGLNGTNSAAALNYYHNQAAVVDDLSASWSGTDADDITSIDVKSDTVVMNSLAAMWVEKDSRFLEQSIDALRGDIASIKGELQVDGILGTSMETGSIGGADLAEYYKSSETFEAGMIVATGNEGVDSIKKTSGSYQKDVLGIVATAPGMILGTKEENSYPIALAGRVPVKVTTENGMILKGDQITSSSLPGYGMVAIETGRVIGTVLEDVDQSQWAECSAEAGLLAGTKCGEVMVFVNLTDFTGMTVADLMTKKGYDAATQNPEFSELFAALAKQEIEGENAGENTVIKSEWTNIFKAANTLGFMQQLSDPASQSFINPQAEIFAKTINASGEVVSPLIVTETLVAKNIKAENIEGLRIIEKSAQDAQSAAEENSGQVKSLGQQVAELQEQLRKLSGGKDGLKVDSADLASKDGALATADPAEIQGSSIFKTVAEFFEKTIFRGSVNFVGTASFNQDAAGYAVIKEGEDRVEVKFDQEYDQAPVVNASLSLQSIEDAEVRQSAEDLLLVSDVKYVITRATKNGFEIRINQKALSDIPFSWTTVSVKDARTFVSRITEKIKNDEEKEESQENILPMEAEAVSTPAEDWPLSEAAENTAITAPAIIPPAEAAETQ